MTFSSSVIPLFCGPVYCYWMPSPKCSQGQCQSCPQTRSEQQLRSELENQVYIVGNIMVLRYCGVSSDSSLTWNTLWQPNSFLGVRERFPKKVSDFVQMKRPSQNFCHRFAPPIVIKKSPCGPKVMSKLPPSCLQVVLSPICPKVITKAFSRLVRVDFSFLQKMSQVTQDLSSPDSISLRSLPPLIGAWAGDVSCRFL